MKVYKVVAITIIIVLVMAVLGCDDGSTNDNGKDITLVCLGDSLTAGYGAAKPSEVDKSKSYPAYLEKKAGIPVINAGVSGDTTAEALARVDSDVLSHKPDIIIILLGANDFLHFISVSTTQSNLQTIIDKVDDGNRKIYLAKFYTDEVATSFIIPIPSVIVNQYDNMFNTLAASSDNIELIEDIWTGVWGVHMSDLIHPNAEGYEIMADNIYKVMEPYLQTLK
jgi:acyl-CoA thioesterase-1